MDNATLLAKLNALPTPDVIEAGTLDDPMGTKEFYRARRVVELLDAAKRKMLLDLWDALPAHESSGDTAGSLRAMLLFSEVGDEIRSTRL